MSGTARCQGSTMITVGNSEFGLLGFFLFIEVSVADHFAAAFLLIA